MTTTQQTVAALQARAVNAIRRALLDANGALEALVGEDGAEEAMEFVCTYAIEEDWGRVITAADVLTIV